MKDNKQIDWRQLFQTKIVGRGESYYKTGMVEDIRIEPTLISASIQGSHPYEVRIKYKNNQLLAMDCTCPYADSDNCKHMAATILAWENEIKNDIYFIHSELQYEDLFKEMHLQLYPTPEKEIDIKGTIQKMEREELESWVFEQLHLSQNTKADFLLLFEKELSTENQFHLLQSKIDNIFLQSEKEPNEEYYSLYDPIYISSYKIEKFIANTLEFYVKSKEYELAYKLCAYIIEKLNYYSIHNYDIDYISIASLCSEQFLSIINNCDQQLLYALSEWTKLYIPRIRDVYLQEVIDNIIDMIDNSI